MRDRVPTHSGQRTCTVHSPSSKVFKPGTDFASRDVHVPQSPTHYLYAARVPDLALYPEQGKGQTVHVEQAMMIAQSALTDSGAGHSFVGSDLVESLPDEYAQVKPVKSKVMPTFVNADGNPMLILGVATLTFTIAGWPYRHEFIVVHGGDLLLLGCDFLCGCRADVCLRPINEESYLMLEHKRSPNQKVRIPLHLENVHPILS